MFDDPREAIQTMIESHISDRVNTNIPATVVSYNAANNRAVVKLAMPKRLDSGESLEPPKVVEVPIVWPASGGGSASFTMPLKPGDGVMLAVQQRSIEGWLSGKTEMPDDPRQFDLSDSVAIAGCSPGGTVAHPDNVVLKFGKANVTLQPDGTIIFGNDGGNITIDSGGHMTLHAASITVDAGGKHFNLEHHLHKNVQSGAALSGEPNP